MAKSVKYPKPQYSRREVNRAGETYMNPNATEEEKDKALIVINNWRVAHNFPLNTFQMRLRSVARNINEKSLVAQRIKRLESIRHKLERYKSMKMAQIQDIGGCRAIMRDISEVEQIVNHYKHESRGVKHKLKSEDDYITNPKPSGYRGVHLIYKYQSDKSNDYNDMTIEIQVRTIVQHAWATAVEIVGTFIRQSLKSSQGHLDWLRFFALMSSAMAITERKPTVPGTPVTFQELREEIVILSEQLHVRSILTGFRKSIEVLSDSTRSDAHYFLLELDTLGNTIHVRGYNSNQLTLASADYAAIEKRIINDKHKNAVLVAADSIEALRLAYPNYYLDADIFLMHLQNVIKQKPKPTKQLSLFN